MERCKTIPFRQYVHIKTGGVKMASKEGLPDYLTTTELAKLLGLTARRIQQLVQDGIIKKDDEKGNRQRKYKANEVIKEYMLYLQDKYEKESENKDDDLIELKKRKLKSEIKQKEATAKISEMKLNEFRSRMHSASDVEDFTNDLVFSVRNALMALPSRMAVDVAKENDPNVVRELLKSEVNSILTELSNYQYNPEKYTDRVREREGLESIEIDDEQE